MTKTLSMQQRFVREETVNEEGLVEKAKKFIAENGKTILISSVVIGGVAGLIAFIICHPVVLLMGLGIAGMIGLMAASGC